MKKRSNKTIAYYFILIWILAAFLLESTDLLISITLYNPHSGWAIFLEKYGELPGIFVILMGVHIYIVTLRTSSNIKTILFTGFLLTIGSLLSVYILWALSYGFSNQTDFFNNYPQYFFLCAVTSNILLSLLFRKRHNFSKKAILFSRISFKMFFYGYVLFVQPIKILWGRIRFRDLVDYYSNFTPWYLPQGITGNQSFPSGHASMGFMMLALFVFFADKAFYKRIILKGIIISWALAVCASRVVIGAHFTSDVLFGAFAMIISYLFLINNANKTLKSEI
ncbi:MAG: phosphatase PAP2 family protein [Ignavibacteriales bacterium]|nr:phosphatase PAP2 family protein [Ignavibacteriales bacterium]